MGEFRSEAGPICPHCGTKFTPDEAHYFDEDLTELDCGYCLRSFRVSVHHRITWTTSKLSSSVKCECCADAGHDTLATRLDQDGVGWCDGCSDAFLNLQDDASRSPKTKEPKP